MKERYGAQDPEGTALARVVCGGSSLVASRSTTTSSASPSRRWQPSSAARSRFHVRVRRGVPDSDGDVGGTRPHAAITVFEWIGASSIRWWQLLSSGTLIGWKRK
jgi:hypothetical protein